MLTNAWYEKKMREQYLISSCVFIIVIFNVGGLTNDINLGALFDIDQSEHEIAFRHAIDFINDKYLFSNRLVPITGRIQQDNVFQVSKTVCSMLSNGIFGIFGPNSKDSSSYVQSACDTMEIPHIETMWNFHQQRGSCLVNIYPYPPVFSNVFVDLIHEFGWKSFTIIYENDDSLIRMSEILKIADLRGYVITFQQLNATYNRNYRPALTEVKKSGQTFFILDCSIRILPDVLQQAMQVGLMSDFHNYIITNLDLHTIDLFPYQHGGVNITGVQLINPEDDSVKVVAKSLEKLKQKTRPHYKQISHPELYFQAELALLYDAVYIFAEALKKLRISKELESKQLLCNESNSWEHGYSIINYIKTNSIQGLTGNVKFDYQGFRSDFQLNLIELTLFGLHKIGVWNSTNGLNISRPILPTTQEDDEGTLHNKSFIVLISLTDPYGMLKKASQRLTGNNRYEGFGIDLIHELSLMLGFNYTFMLQEDGDYGSKNLTTGQWSGMIKELLEYRSDLAITDLTITSEREEAVDFTSPFMSLGISILYKKPMKVAPSVFSFLSPLSSSVWYYLGGAYVGIALLMYIVSRISPAEWSSNYPCIEEPEYLENQFSLRNCFWFALGSLMQQGSELAPLAISGRMIAGMWWFFILIMVSSYTANLAAFLTVESLSSPFKTVEELANQDVIRYGAKRGGATSNFFRNSTYSTYRKIWKFMETNPDVMTSSNPEGVARAENENYAFFMESTTIEYTTERHCNLSQIGRLLDDKGYGIAMRKNSSYRHILSTAVLKLQETGVIRGLKTKWWKEKRGGGLCTSDSSSGDAEELGIPQLGGVFYVLAVGGITGLIVGFLEMFLEVMDNAVRNKTTIKEELKREIKFVFQFKKHTKPVRCRRPRASSLEGFEFSPTAYGFKPDVMKQ